MANLRSYAPVVENMEATMADRHADSLASMSESLTWTKYADQMFWLYLLHSCSWSVSQCTEGRDKPASRSFQEVSNGNVHSSGFLYGSSLKGQQFKTEAKMYISHRPKGITVTTPELPMWQMHWLYNHIFNTVILLPVTVNLILIMSTLGCDTHLALG